MLPTQSKRQNMCPNDECAKHGVVTSVLGGCAECGTALVPAAPIPPTNEQLEDMMIAFGLPVIPGMADRNPEFRQGMLNFHRLIQRGLDGDVDAQERAQLIIDKFKRDAA